MKKYKKKLVRCRHSGQRPGDGLLYGSGFAIHKCLCLYGKGCNGKCHHIECEKRSGYDLFSRYKINKWSIGDSDR